MLPTADNAQRFPTVIKPEGHPAAGPDAGRLGHHTTVANFGLAAGMIRRASQGHLGIRRERPRGSVRSEVLP